MNLKNDFYYAVLECEQEGYFLISMIPKETWDNEGMSAAPDDIEEYAAQFNLPGYSFEATGSNGMDCLDMIERDDGEEVDGIQLVADFKANGYALNDDFADYIVESSDDYFSKVS